MLLDEFLLAGNKRSLEVAAGQLAGSSSMLLVMQDPTQINRRCDKTLGSALANACVMHFFGPADLFTPQIASNKSDGINLRLDRPTDATARARMMGARKTRDIVQGPLLQLHEVASASAHVGSTLFDEHAHDNIDAAFTRRWSQ